MLELLCCVKVQQACDIECSKTNDYFNYMKEKHLYYPEAIYTNLGINQEYYISNILFEY